MIRVLVADDEELVRTGVAAILDATEDLTVVGTAADGAEALAACRALEPDVALLDLVMPGATGLVVARQIRAAVPGCAVVVLTTFDRDSYVAEALQAGLNGFVLKASGPDELAHAVRTANGGGTYISPRITARLLTSSPSSRPPPAGVDDLTPRENEILALLGAGESNQGIARHLYISEGTVKVHMRSVLRKLGVDSRVKAALIAHRAGLVDPRPPGGT